MAPAGGEKNSNEGFVLLEETEAIEAKMQQQQQQQGREGEAPVVEYELASFRHTLSSAGEDDTIYSDEDDVDLDDLSLEDMPTDLQVLCRRLRAQSLALPAEESKHATKRKGEEREEKKAIPSNEEQEERRRRRRERRRQERRRLLKQAEVEGRGIHGLLRFAWPIGTRELLFWALLVVFMTTLITLSEGQHTRAVNTTMTRGTRGGGRGTGASGGEGGQISAPLFVFDNVATAVAAAASASFQQHCPSLLPTFEGGRQTYSLSPYTEIALLQGQLRAQVSLARDREEELKWMRVQQQQLEGKVEVLSRAVEELELCLARRGGKEEGREGKEEGEKQEPMTLNVVPEVRTVKEEWRKEKGEGLWWQGTNRNEHVAHAREAMASLKEGGRKEGFVCPTVTISPGVYSVQGKEEEKEEEERWSGWGTDGDWWSDEEDDADWSEEEEEEEEEGGEEDGGFWWSDAELLEEDEEEIKEGEEEKHGLTPPYVMSPFIRIVGTQRWDEVGSGGKEGEGGACHTACAALDWFQASKKKGGRGRGVVETEGVCAVQSVFGLF